MVEDHFVDGDFVVIERRQTARNGETVVALIDEAEATLKKFYKEGGKVKLQPANAEMKPRLLDAHRVRVQGVVIGVMRAIRK